MSQQEQRQYDKPMTFVKTKRVRTGDVTAKGAEKTVLTFGLVKNFKTGAEENTLDILLEALEQYRGKQVNLTVFLEQKEKDGRTFPSAYIGITEMIPKSEGGGPGGSQPRQQYVAKPSKGATAAEGAAKIRQQFSTKG